MERRVLLAVFLSFLVLYTYQTFLVPPSPPPKSTPAADQPAPQTAAQQNPAAAPTPGQQATNVARAEPAPTALTAESSEREILVETATVSASLSNRGARIMHWRLKEYRSSNGQPLDLVPGALPGDQPTPFALRVEDEEISRRLNTALYRVSGDSNGRVDATGSAASLAFDYEEAGGLRVHKEFRFEPRNYVITFSAEVSASGKSFNPDVQWGPGLGDIGAAAGGGSFFTGNYVQPPELIVHTDGKVQRIAATGLGNQPIREGQYRFAGVDDHYFIAAAINPGVARLEARAVTVPGPGGTQRQFVAQSFRFPRATRTARFFFGPKQFDLLRSVDAELVRAVNFGIFGFLAVPLLGALKWVYGFVGNYGWSIILLTILINLAIFPLRQKSVVSMRKMQALQPQLKAIQDRYASLKVTDPGRKNMNTEVMNLYREKGVNPASGCVPMLLTMPVLFAFYSLLSQSIELRGAAFAWWLKDLSVPDPYYVTPVLMGATMFWQQKLTPSTADPAQQRIMMMMPLMFSFMFLRAPSGLVIYWFVSNLWAIGQQYFTNWLIGPPVMASARPPAERRLKNVGTGRTTGAEKRS